MNYTSKRTEGSLWEDCKLDLLLRCVFQQGGKALDDHAFGSAAINAADLDSCDAQDTRHVCETKSQCSEGLVARYSGSELIVCGNWKRDVEFANWNSDIDLKRVASLKCSCQRM